MKMLQRAVMLYQCNWKPSKRGKANMDFRKMDAFKRGREMVEHLDLLKILGRSSKQIFSQMVVNDGDLPWQNPYKITQ